MSTVQREGGSLRAPETRLFDILEFVRKVDPDEVIRLWVEDGLNTAEIAAKVGVTHQRVSGILREREIPRGPKRARPRLKAADPDLLRKLYVDERMSAPRIAKKLGVGLSTVKRWFNEVGIERRKVGEDNIVIPEIRTLNIGESIDVPRRERTDKGTWTRYYSMAKNAGIRVSLRSVDETTLRLTRVE